MTCPARTTRCPRLSTTLPPRSFRRRPQRQAAPVRVAVEVLLRTGLRVGEFTSLTADAVVQIGAGPWLDVPVGKFRGDRYLPLHPQLVDLIADYRRLHVPPAIRCCFPARTVGPWIAHRDPVPQQSRRCCRAAPHPPPPAANTLATQAINRGSRSRRSPRCSAIAAWT